MKRRILLYSVLPILALLALVYFLWSNSQASRQAPAPVGFNQDPSPSPSYQEPVPSPIDRELEPAAFDGNRALDDVEYQVSLGPRTLGSPAHAKVVDWIVLELEAAGWEVEIQEGSQGGVPVRNIIGKRGQGDPWVVLGAHFDSRLVADRDPDPTLQNQPVPGANDGASGVAVLLELARVLQDPESKDSQPGRTWLVFFDAEDNGSLPGYDWILGSRYFVSQLVDEKPDAAVIVDMIGDRNLDVYLERNSTPWLAQQIWETAAGLGYQQHIIATYRHSMLDDHTPFLQAGIPAVDMIDFDYPYWHTTNDTVDKVSEESLQVIGRTLQAWLATPLTVPTPAAPTPAAPTPAYPMQ